LFLWRLYLLQTRRRCRAQAKMMAATIKPTTSSRTPAWRMLSIGFRSSSFSLPPPEKNAMRSSITVGGGLAHRAERGFDRAFARRVAKGILERGTFGVRRPGRFTRIHD